MEPVTRMNRAAELAHILPLVSGELLSSAVDGNEAIMSLPQLYPGGAPIVVRFRHDGDTFIVSDQGGAYLQAEQLGGLSHFNRIAHSVAKDHYIKFDGNMMFAVEVPRDWLPNAIIQTASASQRAVQLTAERAVEEREQSFKIKLQHQLRETYRKKVAFDVDVVGRSTRRYHFAAMLRGGEDWSVFDLVTPHHVSINSAFVKFSDVKRLEEAPKRVAVLTDREKMNSGDISLISESANFVIPITANIRQLHLAA